MHPVLADLTEKQYEDLYHVDDAPIADLRQKALSRLGWWAVALTLAGVLAGSLVRFPDMIQVPFVVKSEVAEEIYRFPSTVYVEKILVANGQAVAAGTPVLEVSAPGIAALVNEYTTAQARLGSFAAHKTAASASERGILQINIEKTRQDIRLQETQLQLLRRQWETEAARLHYDVTEAERVYAANGEIYKSGDISKNELHHSEAALLRARHAYAAAHQAFLSEQSNRQKQIAAGQLEVRGLEKQIAKTTSDLNLEGEQLRSTLQALARQIEGTYGAFEITPEHHLRLKAKRAGQVSFLFEGEKEAAPGMIVLKLIGQEAPLYAHVQVGSAQIGRIRAGQAAVLKLDPYPVYEWGSVAGRVTGVSLTPDEKGLFNVRVQLTEYHKLDRLVRIGMRGSGNIIFEERTLFGYIFRKFRQVSGELTE